MKYTKEFERLGLPNYFKFGIEIEADNVKTKGKESLYTGKSAEYIKSKNWHMATSKEEMLVSEGGAELVSPILSDSKQDWQDVSNMCEQIKKYPGKNGNEVVANSKCGLHVHFDSECLTSNQERFRNFMRLYAESEELLYKMCNDKNDPIRKGAINKDYKGIHIISALWRNGMAAPSSEKILKHIQNDTLKISHKKFGKLKMFASKYKLDERRYNGLNLTNIGNEKKNTIEILSLIFRSYWATDEEKIEFANKDKQDFIENENYKEKQYKDITEIFKEKKNINKVTLDTDLIVSPKENIIKKWFKKLLNVLNLKYSKK